MKNYFRFFFLSFLSMLFACTANELANFEQGGSSGSITRFATFGNYMYVVNPSELQTFDISDAGNPVFLNSLVTENGLETIFIYEERIYLGARQGLYIIGIDDPGNPVLLSQTQRRNELLLGACDPVIVRDNYAYSTVKIIQNVCGSFGARSALLVFEVSDPENPEELDNFDLETPNGLGFKDDYLFVCDTGADLLKVFDISDPENTFPNEDLDFAIASPIDMIVDGDRMIVSTEQDFKILDVSDITEIELVKIIEKGE